MAPAVRDHALFQSTPSVWRETSNLSVSVALPPISIHSLRVEGDGSTLFASGTRNTISIHSLRVEGDAGCLPRQRRHSHFNPLPPCGGRPVRRQKPPQIRWYFNPLPPCGGRRAASASAMILLTISIHSLRVEGDWTRSARSPTISNFNPLPPCGGRPNFAAVRLAPVYFNPLPPCGGRHREYRARNRDKIFQSTPSVWRETDGVKNAWKFAHFNPLPPCGGRLRCHDHACGEATNFNPLPPCGGRPRQGDSGTWQGVHFNPLPPCGGRPATPSSRPVPSEFQSTPSVWRETVHPAALGKI